MNCRACLPKLSPYRDNALPPGEAASVAEHLDACAACRAALAGLDRVLGTLAVLPELTPSAGFHGALLARLEAVPLGGAPLGAALVDGAPAPAGSPERASGPGIAGSLRRGWQAHARDVLLGAVAASVLAVIGLTLLTDDLPSAQQAQGAPVAVQRDAQLDRLVAAHYERATQLAAPAQLVAEPEVPVSAELATVIGVQSEDPALRALSGKIRARLAEVTVPERPAILRYLDHTEAARGALARFARAARAQIAARDGEATVVALPPAVRKWCLCVAPPLPEARLKAARAGGALVVLDAAPLPDSPPLSEPTRGYFRAIRLQATGMPSEAKRAFQAVLTVSVDSALRGLAAYNLAELHDRTGNAQAGALVLARAVAEEQTPHATAVVRVLAGRPKRRAYWSARARGAITRWLDEHGAPKESVDTAADVPAAFWPLWARVALEQRAGQSAEQRAEQRKTTLAVRVQRQPSTASVAGDVWVRVTQFSCDDREAAELSALACLNQCLQSRNRTRQQQVPDASEREQWYQSVEFPNRARWTIERQGVRVVIDVVQNNRANDAAPEPASAPREPWRSPRELDGEWTRPRAPGAPRGSLVQRRFQPAFERLTRKLQGVTDDLAALERRVAETDDERVRNAARRRMAHYRGLQASYQRELSELGRDMLRELAAERARQQAKRGREEWQRTTPRSEPRAESQSAGGSFRLAPAPRAANRPERPRSEPQRDDRRQHAHSGASGG